MPSFRRVVEALGGAWIDREQVLEQADTLTDAVRKEMRLAESCAEEGGGSRPGPGTTTALDADHLQEVVVEGLAAGYDPQWGGFGPARKLTVPTLVELCLLGPAAMARALRRQGRWRCAR